LTPGEGFEGETEGFVISSSKEEEEFELFSSREANVLMLSSD
jgi:hypothetical protein